MSKTTATKKPVAKKKPVAAKAAPKQAVKAPVKKKAEVAVNRNVLMFLVLTLILAAVMLVVQAQTNNLNVEQDKAQSALENETSAKQDTAEGMNHDGMKKP
jgi:cell division protein FtsL